MSEQFLRNEKAFHALSYTLPGEKLITVAIVPNIFPIGRFLTAQLHDRAITSYNNVSVSIYTECPITYVYDYAVFRSVLRYHVSAFTSELLRVINKKNQRQWPNPERYGQKWLISLNYPSMKTRNKDA